MKPSRVALIAAITAAVAWTLKTVAIGLAGGLDRSALESPLFALGLVAVVVAFAALGVAVAGGRPLAHRIVGGVVGVVIGVGLSALASWIAAAVIPESAGWVQAEAGLWVTALLALIATAYWHTGRGTARTA